VRLLDLKKGDVVYFPSRYKPAPIAASAPLHWRVLVSEPGREKTTVARLLDLELGLKPYLALEHKQLAAGRGRKRDVAVPMFASYIFIPMPDIDEIWHEVRHVRGVQDFLSSATRLPKMLAPGEIEKVRLKELALDAKRLQQLAASGDYPLPIGERVWVKDLLPFQALLGNVTEYDRSGRAGVALEQSVLGRKFFWIEPHRLQAVE
jgi:transcription antitermination factor NusG